MRYDAVMGLRFSTVKLIIHESFFGSNMWSLQGALTGFASILAAISVLCVLPSVQTMRQGQESPRGIVFHGLILSGMFSNQSLGKPCVDQYLVLKEIGWENKTVQGSFSLPASTIDVYMGPLSLVHDKDEASGLEEIEILSGLLRGDRRCGINKRVKEERARNKTLKCIHHQCTFHGSFWDFLGYLLQMKLQRFPTYWDEIEPNMTIYFLCSCFSFMHVFIVHRPSSSALSCLPKMAFFIAGTFNVLLSMWLFP